MEGIYRRFQDRVEFFVVYAQEAHFTDGWQTDSNIDEGVLFRQHQSYDEREEVAQTCSLDLHMQIPILVEEMDNAIGKLLVLPDASVISLDIQLCKRTLS